MRAGRYELHDVVGAGAFATVYRATDPRLDAEVAVKVLADNWSRDVDVRMRFRAEAVLLRKVQARADVPGMIDVFDIDETDDDRPFFVMTYADRGTLRQRAGGAAWPATDVLPVVEALATTVGALHQASVIHRDLKPSNLLLRSDERAAGGTGALVGPGERLLVGDLGLAKDASLETTTLSFAGGTARYMAPEQQAPGTPVDYRVDIHAASVIVAELLGGSDSLPPVGTPLEGQLPATLEPRIRSALERGVSTDPDARHASIEEWHDDVAGALKATAQPAPAMRRWRSAAVAALFLAIIAVASTIVLTRGGSDLEIVGPDRIVVGDLATFGLDADDSNDTPTWTDWNGDQVTADRFEILASLPGTLRFSAEVAGEETDRTIEVVESPLGPTINGPASMRVGEIAVLTATLPAATASSYWLDPAGDRVDSSDYRLEPVGAGTQVVSIVSIDDDGIERGARLIVEVEP